MTVLQMADCRQRLRGVLPTGTEAEAILEDPIPHPSATSLTPWQKLEALSMRFYGRMPWTPKVGDYYTTSRADLELYQIVAIRDGIVFTRYCDENKSKGVSEWSVDSFLSEEGFGYARVYVHPVCLRPHPMETLSGDG